MKHPFSASAVGNFTVKERSRLRPASEAGLRRAKEEQKEKILTLL